MKIPEDFRELLRFLNYQNVDYLIVGGYALAFHGAPRFTGDLDLFIATSETNAKQLLRALDKFGMGSLGLKTEDFMFPDTVVQLGYPPLRVDILTEITGVKWDRAWQNRVCAEIDELKLNFLGLEDLIDNKKAVGRNIDLGDIDRLLEQRD